MGKNVIITGASGMVGQGVLLECLDHADIDTVLCIVRRPLEQEHPKLRQLIHPDFSSFAEVRQELRGYDAVYLSMGVSAAGMAAADYERITFDYTLALARELVSINPGMTCTYVSGAGTDSSEQGRQHWARVKGKTENALLNLGFAQAYMFRPGVIIPERGIRSRTRMYQFFYDYFMWFIRLIQALAPKSVVTTTQLGLAMIHATQRGYPEPIIDPADIHRLADGDS